MTAIDISETSLRHTRDLQQKYRLRNLDLHRLAIEQVGELGQTFDQIVCTGVLHHLPDPDIGLRALRNVLAPNGAMHLMVYATYGRAGIYMMQEYCRLLGVGATEAELRDLGTTIGALSADHPIAGVSRRAKDFSNPDALADALLHPQDRAYTVPQLYAWLERCGLSFGRWFEQAPYLPQCGAIASLPHAARLVSLPPPLQHAAVELLRGTMAKHNFIAYRDDRLGDEPADHVRRRRLAGLRPSASAVDPVHPRPGAPRFRGRPDQSGPHLPRPRPPDRCGTGASLRRNRRQPLYRRDPADRRGSGR